MAKKQTFAEKMLVKADSSHCAVCDSTIQHIKHVKAVRSDKGAWKFRSLNIGVCKCNEKEVYA